MTDYYYKKTKGKRFRPYKDPPPEATVPQCTCRAKGFNPRCSYATDFERQEMKDYNSSQFNNAVDIC